MMFIRSISFVLAAVACAGLPASAMAQDKRCVSRAESQAVVAHLMPSLLGSVQKRCAAQIGTGSYLATRGSALADRLTPLSRAAWPEAKLALERQGGQPLPDNEAILNFGRQAIADGVANGMDANACRFTDQLLTQLAPLPPENLTNVFSLFLEAGINNSKDSPLRVCEAQRG